MKVHEAFLTLKQGADFPPACDSSLTGKLTECGLQEKHGDAAAYEEDDVRNKEGTFIYPRDEKKAHKKKTSF